jgi:hypothetical protein
MSQNPPRLTWIAKLGLVLAIGSFLPWLLVLGLPFLPLSISNKALGTLLLLVTAEAMFWLGALLAGQELVRRYRQQLNPRKLWKRIRRLWGGKD